MTFDLFMQLFPFCRRAVPENVLDEIRHCAQRGEGYFAIQDCVHEPGPVHSVTGEEKHLNVTVELLPDALRCDVVRVQTGRRIIELFHADLSQLCRVLRETFSIFSAEKLPHILQRLRQIEIVKRVGRVRHVFQCRGFAIVPEIFFRRNMQPVRRLQRKDRFKHPADLRCKVGKKLFIAGIKGVFVHRRHPLEGVGGNTDLQSAGCRHGNEAIRTQTFPEETDHGVCVPVIAPEPVPEQHLVPGVVGTDGLLPPGAVFVLFVQTEPQGLRRDLMGFHEERVGCYIRGRCHGIPGQFGGDQPDLMDVRHASGHMDFDIAAGGAAHHMCESLCALFCGVPVHKRAGKNDPPHMIAIGQIFPVGDVQHGPGGCGQFHGEKARILLAQIVEKIGPVAPCFRVPDVAFVQLSMQFFRTVPQQFSLTDDFARDELFHHDRRRRTRPYRTVCDLLCMDPAVCSRITVRVKEPAVVQRAGKDRHIRTGKITFIPAAKPCGGTGCNHIPSIEKCRDQPRFSVQMGGKTVAAEIGGDLHRIDSVLTASGHIRFGISLVRGKVRVLSERRQSAVDTAGVVARNGKPQHDFFCGVSLKRCMEKGIGIIRAGITGKTDPFCGTKVVLVHKYLGVMPIYWRMRICSQRQMPSFSFNITRSRNAVPGDFFVPV